MLPVLQPSTLRRRTLRRHIRARAIAVVTLAVVALAAAAVIALAGGGGLGGDAIPAEVRDEAKYQGLDPALLAAVVEHDEVALDHTGSETELRSAARRLRRGIDRHQSVIGALTASRVGDERVSRWLARDPRLATHVEAVPDRAARAFVRRILATSGATPGGTGT